MAKKVTVNQIRARLSVLGYNLITSKYTLVSVKGKEYLDHKIAYYLRDTKNEEGIVTFSNGKTSCKNGLAIDESLLDFVDWQRPLKLIETPRYIKLVCLDYEKEQSMLDKVTSETVINYAEIPEGVTHDMLENTMDILHTDIFENTKSVEQKLDNVNADLNKQILDAYQSMSLDMHRELKDMKDFLFDNVSTFLTSLSTTRRVVENRFNKIFNCFIFLFIFNIIIQAIIIGLIVLYHLGA